MNNCFFTVFAVLLGLQLTGCSSNPEKKEKDDILSGKIAMLVDETVLPILMEQKDVFESSYNAEIEIIAQPEVMAINGLLKGDAPLAFLTRTLSEAERKGFDDRSISGRIYSVAYDGIVLVINRDETDTTVRIPELIEAFKGNPVMSKKLVFDNANSSVLRYFRELSGVDKVASPYIEAKQNSQEVLAEIAGTDGKIGLLSYNQYLSLKSSFKGLDKIRILSVLNEKLPAPKYVKPSQESLATDEYPLKREILVLNYQPKIGLGIGFSSFLTGDRGQRIVLKSGLLPATMPGRELIIRDRIE